MAMAAILSSPAVPVSELRAGAQSTAAPSSASANFAPCVGLRVLRGSQRNASPLTQSASSCQHARRMPVSTMAASAAAAAAVAAAPVAVLPVLTFEGTPAGEAELSLKTARAETAKGLVHRALITYMQNRRRGTASTLTRAEVRGGGRKPMKQKGTGNARLGSRRTPLKPGGGVVFGPKPCDWTIKINKKERRLAVGTALQSAAENMTVIEDFEEADFPAPKTKDFVAALRRWGVDYKEDNTLLFAADLPDSVALSCRNIEKLKVATPAGLNIYDVLRADKVIVTVSGLDYLNRRFGGLGFEESDDEGGDGVVVEEINLPTAAQIAELTGEAVEEAEASEEAEEAEEESGDEE